MRKAAKSAKQKAAPSNVKWICNAYGYEHDSPDDCSKPEQDGVWVSIDENGKRSRYTPPTKGDLDRLKKAEDALAVAEFNLATNKSNLVNAEKDLKQASEKFNADTTAYDKKVASLSDPKQVITNLKSEYEAAALRTGKVDPEIPKSFDKMKDFTGSAEPASAWSW